MIPAMSALTDQQVANLMYRLCAKVRELQGERAEAAHSIDGLTKTVRLLTFNAQTAWAERDAAQGEAKRLREALPLALTYLEEHIRFDNGDYFMYGNEYVGIPDNATGSDLRVIAAHMDAQAGRTEAVGVTEAITDHALKVYNAHMQLGYERYECMRAALTLALAQPTAMADECDSPLDQSRDDRAAYLDDLRQPEPTGADAPWPEPLPPAANQAEQDRRDEKFRHSLGLPGKRDGEPTGADAVERGDDPYPRPLRIAVGELLNTLHLYANMEDVEIRDAVKEVEDAIRAIGWGER